MNQVFIILFTALFVGLFSTNVFGDLDKAESDDKRYAYKIPVFDTQGDVQGRILVRKSTDTEHDIRVYPLIEGSKNNHCSSSHYFKVEDLNQQPQFAFAFCDVAEGVVFANRKFLECMDQSFCRIAPYRRERELPFEKDPYWKAFLDMTNNEELPNHTIRSDTKWHGYFETETANADEALMFQHCPKPRIVRVYTDEDYYKGAGIACTGTEMVRAAYVTLAQSLQSCGSARDYDAPGRYLQAPSCQGFLKSVDAEEFKQYKMGKFK